MERKNVLIVSSEFPPQPGGIGNHAYNLALQLSENGYTVDVIVDQRSIEGREEKQFDAKLPFSVSRTAITTPRFIMYFKRLSTIFKLIKTTNHVIATGKFSLWSVAFSSLFYKRNFIAIAHGTEVNFKSAILKSSINLSLKRFRTIIAVSTFTKQLISKVHSNIVVIPNGFDSEKWDVKRNHSSRDLEGSPKLVTVGNVTSRKGQQNVIAHLPELIKQYPNIHYHCIGLKTESNSFFELAKRLKVDSHITFHGRVNDAELQIMLNDSDIFVMLSRETKTGDVEGFGIAILEANALGVPAIGAKGCGIEDAIAVGKSGILINSNNYSEFLEAIAELLNNEAKFKEGSISWANMHKWSDIVKHYITHLK